jgi:hypothetical protein
MITTGIVGSSTVIVPVCVSVAALDVPMLNISAELTIATTSNNRVRFLTEIPLETSVGAR